jgi:hypothetical protein
MPRHYKPTGRPPGRPPGKTKYEEPAPAPVFDPDAVALVRKRDPNALELWTEEERALQEDELERLMIQGARIRDIFRIMTTSVGNQAPRWPALTMTTLNTRLQTVLERRRTEYRATTDQMRWEQYDRLQEYRRLAMGMTPPDIRAAVIVEKQISTLFGLCAPKKVDVNIEGNVNETLTAVIADLDPEQVEELLSKQREEERLAAVARKHLPQSIIDVEVVAADAEE